MIVSWNWLRDYVALDMDRAEAENRLAMAGLNHEGTEAVDDDFAIDLEVTSNRPDCLGHIGIAREIAVLYDKPLKVPAAAVQGTGEAVDRVTRVTIECPQMCSRYIARVIRGVRIGPSPDWLQRRLRTCGQPSISNVVDITNYVLLECGQPLHAFDLARLRGPEIIVREARGGELLEAIDHRQYPLEPGMCVIADARDPVALAGIMGGARTEVDADTRDLLIESAEFAPLAIRTTSRKLKLDSESSRRFERGVDPQGVDWASRRCCELILELAGGQLLHGALDAGPPPVARPPVTLRLSQLKRILGIEVDPQEVKRILLALGARQLRAEPRRVEVIPPSWRRDLSREIDLVEEVARIHGYDKIPEDVAVPMVPSHRTDADRVLQRVRGVLTGAGFDEAMTPSVVKSEWNEVFHPWSNEPPLVCSTPMLKGASQVRVSLVPSLLEARRVNESLSNAVIELFETARIYLPRPAKLPAEQLTLAVTSGRDFLHVKGVIEALVTALHQQADLSLSDVELELLEPGRSCRLGLGERLLGYLGEVSAAGLKKFGLRGPTTIAEISLQTLAASACLVPQASPLSAFPAMARDLNVIVEETLRWAELSATVRRTAGPLLESLAYRETFRNRDKDGPGKKRLVFHMEFRAPDRTLTSEEADEIRDRVVQAVAAEHGGRLLSA